MSGEEEQVTRVVAIPREVALLGAILIGIATLIGTLFVTWSWSALMDLQTLPVALRAMEAKTEVLLGGLKEQQAASAAEMRERMASQGAHTAERIAGIDTRIGELERKVESLADWMLIGKPPMEQQQQRRER